jgi:hypothetical protein
LAHAQQLPSIESLSESYVACVQSAFVRRLDDFGASNLPQASERAFLDCRLEEDALYTTAAASAPGNSQDAPKRKALVDRRGFRRGCQQFRLQFSLEFFDRGTGQGDSSSAARRRRGHSRRAQR